MGGKVTVASEVGKGSTFTMTFKSMCKISTDDDFAH
jgi:signal transduction histidine kinase